jgi:hypothetical protein
MLYDISYGYTHDCSKAWPTRVHHNSIVLLLCSSQVVHTIRKWRGHSSCRKMPSKASLFPSTTHHFSSVPRFSPYPHRAEAELTGAREPFLVSGVVSSYSNIERHTSTTYLIIHIYVERLDRPGHVETFACSSFRLIRHVSTISSDTFLWIPRLQISFVTIYCIIAENN